jgi:pyruvate carboxylase subunit B
VPTVSQLKEVAPAIIRMGCFDRVETNGGAFEQVNLLFGENPNKAVREWTAPFHEAGIHTQKFNEFIQGAADRDSRSGAQEFGQMGDPTDW